VYTINKLLLSLCNTNNCRENKKISFYFGNNNVLHFRIDGVFITDTTIKKNDCLVSYNNRTGNRNQHYLFLIEVKDESYSFDEVITQLQNGRNILNEVFNKIDNRYKSIDDIYPLLPTNYKNKKFASLALDLIKDVKKNRHKLIPILCAKKKIEFLKRTTYSQRFRIKVGKNTIPIFFVKHGTDVISELNRILAVP
jgi:hypothetical protein